MGMDNLEQQQRRPVAHLNLDVVVYDDDTLDDRFKFNGTAEDLANIFLTLALSEPEYEGALIAACHSLMVQRGMNLEEFVDNAISKMN